MTFRRDKKVDNLLGLKQVSSEKTGAGERENALIRRVWSNPKTGELSETYEQNNEDI